MHNLNACDVKTHNPTQSTQAVAMNVSYNDDGIFYIQVGSHAVM
jgi:hypothetical protein